MTRFACLALLAAVSLLSASCGGKRPVPSDPSVVLAADSILAPEKMALILSDVHLAEAALLTDRNRGMATDRRAAFLYEGIYRKYGISDELYRKNLKYYLANPDAYVKVYERVIAILEQKQPGKPPAPTR